MTNLNLMLLVLMVAAAVWAVMARSLLKAAIGLAIASIIITIFMFEFNSPLAAVFELSVCSGLITVIFLSTIGLTRPLSHKELLALSRDRGRRYGFMPLLVIACGAILAFVFLKMPLDLEVAKNTISVGAREVLWNFRHLDLFGQIMILLAGGFGAVLLFRETNTDEW